MGLDIPFVKPAVGFHGIVKVDAPLKASTEFNIPLAMMETKFAPPKQVAFFNMLINYQ